VKWVDSPRRDREEKLALASIYLNTSRCLGGHVVNSGYVCPWCKSNQPSAICFKEKVRKASEKPSDYLDEAERKRVAKFEVLP
jgi:hypothetical protein